MNPKIILLDVLLNQQRESIAQKVVEKQYEREAAFWSKFGEEGRRISLRDAAYHLPFITESIRSDDHMVFTEYIDWLRQLFHNLGFPDDTIITTIECMRETFVETLSPDLHELFHPVLDAGIGQLTKPLAFENSYIDETTKTGRLTRLFLNALLEGDRMRAGELILRSVEEGISITTIYMDVFQRSQYEVGRLWLSNQISVAKEHFCSAATQSIMAQLYPYIFSTNRKGKKMVAACVGGELHEIGIRMVADFFELDGWDTYYLGANAPASAILSSIEENQADLLALSVSMPYHRPLVRETISKIRQSRVGADLKIMIGGRAINMRTDRAKLFGADGYAVSAYDAIQFANELTS